MITKVPLNTNTRKMLNRFLGGDCAPPTLRTFTEILYTNVFLYVKVFTCLKSCRYLFLLNFLYTERSIWITNLYLVAEGIITQEAA